MGVSVSGVSSELKSESDLYMKKNIFILLILVSAVHLSHAQDTTHKHRIAIFAPLYLDSAFDEVDEYRYAKNVFPKFINPGLEFYEGAQLALDSLNKEYAPLEVFIYDTRSANETILQQLNRPEMDSVELIITHCSSNEINPRKFHFRTTRTDRYTAPLVPSFGPRGVFLSGILATPKGVALRGGLRRERSPEMAPGWPEIDRVVDPGFWAAPAGLLPY